MRSKLFFILALLMFLVLPSVRAHAETTAPDRVDSAEALSQWLDSHKESGGQVALDADIEWEGYFKFLTKAPVIIDAGSYSFHLNYRSYLGFSGPVTIKGSPLSGWPGAISPSPVSVSTPAAKAPPVSMPARAQPTCFSRFSRPQGRTPCLCAPGPAQW